MAPLSVRAIKKAVNLAVEVDLDSGLDYEQGWSTILAMSDDR